MSRRSRTTTTTSRWDESEKKKLRANCNEYEQAINDNKELKGWKAKAYMAKEAGIEPGTYALFQTALSLINADGGTPANDEITQAVKLVSGISDSQRAYLWQAAYGKDTTKNNPWGGAKVTKYQKRENEARQPGRGRHAFERLRLASVVPDEWRPVLQRPQGH